jgi:hypothetical protein
MKKKMSRRLTLFRETLHPLEDRRLDEAVGAATVGGTCCARSDSCQPPTFPCSPQCPTGTNICF